MSVTKSKRKSTSPRKSPAEAVMLTHADGEHHIVGIGNIRVVLVPDGSRWFAQGLEVDYVAQGDSIEDVKKKFENGLEATIQEHLRVYGNIDSVLSVAPNEAWRLLFEKGATRKFYSQVTSHHVVKELMSPYAGINYLVAAATHNAA